MADVPMVVLPPDARTVTEGGIGFTAHGPASCLPMRGFVPNLGQWTAVVRYVGMVGSLLVRVEGSGLLLVSAGRIGPPDADVPPRLVGDAVRLRFGEAFGCVDAVAVGFTPGRHSFLLGSDPARWVRDVQAASAVRLADASPGIDVVLGDSGGQLEYDLVIRPGGDLSGFAVECEGHTSLSLDASGDLLLGTVHGTLRQTIPHSWEVLADGSKHVVRTRFRILGPNHYGFDVEGPKEGHEEGRVLVIDPVIQWATFIGGSGAESGGAVGVSGNGEVLIASSGVSLDFPVTPGAFDIVGDAIAADAAVTRLTADGSALVYSTHLGGSGTDGIGHLRILSDDSVLLAGTTGSSDFPVTPGAFDSTYGGGTTYDTFVAKLSADGSDLHFATYLGGSLGDPTYDMALAANGTIILAGRTCSDDFPTTPGAFNTVENGHCDGFITALAPDGGSLVFSTYIGASEAFAEDILTGVDVEPDGSVLVVGTTMGTDYPTTSNAAEPTATSNWKKGVLTRLSADGSMLLYSSYMGTVFAPGALLPQKVRVAPDGTLLVVGLLSTGFVGPGLPATEGSFQPVKPGAADLFVSRLDATGKTFLKSTHLGGLGNDYPGGIDVDAAGRIYLGGQAQSTFPITPNAFDSSVLTTCGTDGFVAVLEPDLATYRYGSFIGNSVSSCTFVQAVAADGCGGLVVTAWDAGPTWPTTSGAWDTSYNGGPGDTWVARLQALDPWSTLPGGVSGALGTPALLGVGPPCAGDVVRLQLGDAQPMAPVVLVMGLSQLDAPFKGGTLVPAPDLILTGLATDAQGNWSLTAPWPVGVPNGLDVWFQAWVADASARKGYAGSNGVLLDVF